MTQEWLSVKELSSRLNIKEASVRMKAKRGNWERKKDNQGTMRYAVDLDDPKLQKVSKPDNVAKNVTQHLDNMNETLSSRAVSVRQTLKNQIDMMQAQIDLKDQQLADASEEKKQLLELLKESKKQPSLWKRFFG